MADVGNQWQPMPFGLPPLLVLITCGLLASLYCYTVGKFIQPRSRKLAAALLLPLALYQLNAAPDFGRVCESVLFVQSLTCLIGCCGLKVISLAMCRGVLARELAAGSSWWRFTGAMLMPLIPANNRDTLNRSSRAQQQAPSGSSGAKQPQQAGSTATSSSSSNNNSNSIHQAAGGSKWARIMSKVQWGALKLCVFMVVALSGMWAFFKLQDSIDHHAHEAAVAAGGSRKKEQVILWLQMDVTQPILYYLSGIGLLLQVDGVGDLLDAVALGLWGIDAEPHFRRPFFSASLAECWGRRWNLTMNSILRDLVYEPIMDKRLFAPCTWGGSSSGGNHTTTHQHSDTSVANGTIAVAAAAGRASVPNGSAANDHASSNGAASNSMLDKGAAKEVQHGRPRRSYTLKLAASLATFLVSGLWHELVMMHMTGGYTTFGVWTAHFLANGVAVAIEAVIKAKAKAAGIKLPRWLSVILFNIVFVTILSWLWMPPLLWQLPNTCLPTASTNSTASVSANATATHAHHHTYHALKARQVPDFIATRRAHVSSPTSSLLERIMEQSHRDLSHTVHVIKARAAAAHLQLGAEQQQAVNKALRVMGVQPVLDKISQAISSLNAAA